MEKCRPKCKSSECETLCRKIANYECNLEKRFNIIFKEITSGDLYRVIISNDVYFSKSKIEQNMHKHLCIVLFHRVLNR